MAKSKIVFFFFHSFGGLFYTSDNPCSVIDRLLIIIGQFR